MAFFENMYMMCNKILNVTMLFGVTDHLILARTHCTGQISPVTPSLCEKLTVLEA